MADEIGDRAQRIGKDPRSEALLALASSYGMHGHEDDPVQTATEAQAAAAIYLGDQVAKIKEEFGPKEDGSMGAMLYEFTLAMDTFRECMRGIENMVATSAQRNRSQF